MLCAEDDMAMEGREGLRHRTTLVRLLSPLRGLRVCWNRYQGLTPLAIDFRRFAAVCDYGLHRDVPPTARPTAETLRAPASFPDEG